MTGSPTVLLLATAGITLLLAPALALFFGGRPDQGRLRALAVGIPAAMALATVEWILLGADLGVAAYQGSLVATAVALVLSVGLRTGPLRGYAVFCALWITLVLVPVGYALFDVVHGPLATTLGTLDFGGASILAVCTGTAGLALALVSRPLGNAVGGPPRRSRRAYVFAGVGALAGWLAVEVGSELVFDATTMTVAVNELWAAAAGLTGWTIAQVINARRATAAGLVAGVLAGSIVVLPASPWLDAASVVVLALIAGVLGHITAAAARRGGFGAWATFLGVCSVPAAIGLVGAGIVARGSGLVFSGHVDLLAAQLGGLVIVSGYSLVVTAVLVIAVDRSLHLLGSSRLVDETIVRLYSEFTAGDVDAVMRRLHERVRWQSAPDGVPLDGQDAVRALLTENLAARIELMPLKSRRMRHGWIAVDVRRIRRDSDGAIVDDSVVAHAFRERAGLFDRVQTD